MKRFMDKPESWQDKINYVDKNNRVVGFDTGSKCCESFGHAVVKELPKKYEDLKDYEGFVEDDLDPYSFVNEKYTNVEMKEMYVEGGGTLAFKIEAEGLPNLYVLIWNHHHGYYSHGFTTWDEKDGSL